VLARFLAALDDVHSDRFEHIVLFGARPRQCWPEMDKLVPLMTDIVQETGVVIRLLHSGPEDGKAGHR
jgi:hypothetical protein